MAFWLIYDIDRFVNNCFREMLFFEVCYLNHIPSKYKGGVTTLSQRRRIGNIGVVKSLGVKVSPRSDDNVVAKLKMML